MTLDIYLKSPQPKSTIFATRVQIFRSVPTCSDLRYETQHFVDSFLKKNKPYIKKLASSKEKTKLKKPLEKNKNFQGFYQQSNDSQAIKISQEKEIFQYCLEWFLLEIFENFFKLGSTPEIKVLKTDSYLKTVLTNYTSNFQSIVVKHFIETEFYSVSTFPSSFWPLFRREAFRPQTCGRKAENEKDLSLTNRKSVLQVKSLVVNQSQMALMSKKKNHKMKSIFLFKNCLSTLVEGDVYELIHMIFKNRTYSQRKTIKKLMESFFYSLNHRKYFFFFLSVLISSRLSFKPEIFRRRPVLARGQKDPFQPEAVTSEDFRPHAEKVERSKIIDSSFMINSNPIPRTLLFVSKTPNFFESNQLKIGRQSTFFSAFGRNRKAEPLKYRAQPKFNNLQRKEVIYNLHSNYLQALLGQKSTPFFFAMLFSKTPTKSVCVGSFLFSSKLKESLKRGRVSVLSNILQLEHGLKKEFCQLSTEKFQGYLPFLNLTSKCLQISFSNIKHVPLLNFMSLKNNFLPINRVCPSQKLGQNDFQKTVFDVLKRIQWLIFFQQSRKFVKILELQEFHSILEALQQFESKKGSLKGFDLQANRKIEKNKSLKTFLKQSASGLWPETAKISAFLFQPKAEMKVGLRPKDLKKQDQLEDFFLIQKKFQVVTCFSKILDFDGKIDSFESFFSNQYLLIILTGIDMASSLKMFVESFQTWLDKPTICFQLNSLYLTQKDDFKIHRIAPFYFKLKMNSQKARFLSSSKLIASQPFFETSPDYGSKVCLQFFESSYSIAIFENNKYVVQPVSEALFCYLKTLKAQIKSSSTKTQILLIKNLTAKLYTWCYCFRYVSNRRLFYYLDSRLLNFLWQWGCRRHSNKSKKWVKSKYFYNWNQKTWIFAVLRNLNREKQNRSNSGLPSQRLGQNERFSIKSFPCRPLVEIKAGTVNVESTRFELLFLYLPFHAQIVQRLKKF